MPRPPARPTSRFLALVFPHLGVDRLRSQRGHLFVGRDPGPLATVRQEGRSTCLVAVDPAAAALGLAPGQPLAAARALVPALEVFAADAAAELDWLAALGEACSRDAPAIALAPPDTLLLDITDAAQPERELAGGIEARLARRGIVVRHACGHTPDAARALARFAGAAAPDEHQALRRLPAAALDLDRDDIAAMQDAGCRTIADLAALSPAGLAARFGAEAAAGLRRLFDPTACAALPGRAALLTVEHRPDPAARLADSLANVAERLAAALDDRGERGLRFDAWLFAVDGTVCRRTIAPAQPTADAAALERLLRATFADGEGDLIRVDVPAVAPHAAALFPLVADAGRRARTPHRPARPTPPEQPELLLAPPPPRPAPAEPTRPIHLFDPPQPIRPVAPPSDGPPAAFRWRRTLHRVARATGPERLAGQLRDYYRVEDGRGRRLWIFRDAAIWYVHGVFA